MVALGGTVLIQYPLYPQLFLFIRFCFPILSSSWNHLNRNIDSSNSFLFITLPQLLQTLKWDDNQFSVNVHSFIYHSQPSIKRYDFHMASTRACVSATLTWCCWLRSKGCWFQSEDASIFWNWRQVILDYYISYRKRKGHKIVSRNQAFSLQLI